jgi:hypothetical protein
VDLNEDGQGDILSGSYSRRGHEDGMAGVFQVLYGSADGKFAAAAELNGVDGKPLVIPADNDTEIPKKICTRPTAVDWDGDGDLDLVVGNFEGTFCVFSGEGKGKFDPVPKFLDANDGEALKVPGAHSDPALVDWDGDGDLDILSGSSEGGVHWAENLGEGSVAAFKTIIEAGSGDAWGEAVKLSALKGAASSTRVFAADVDGDGKLDLLVGDQVTVETAAGGSETTGFVWFYRQK